MADAGVKAVGIDISPTMLEHCRALVPGAHALHALDDAGRTPAQDGSAALVFSYSVLQHVGLLGAYIAALDEICRLLAPGGVVALQLNCEDFKSGPRRGAWPDGEPRNLFAPLQGLERRALQAPRAGSLERGLHRL